MRLFSFWLTFVPFLIYSWIEPSQAQPRAAFDERQTSPASAQPAIEVPPAIREAAGRIQYVGPDTFILLDADGRPQPVPGVSYEDFLAAWKRAQNANPAARQPRFVIETLNIAGTVDDSRATLQYDLTLRLLTNEPVAVPLALGAAILQDQPQFKLSRESRVDGREPEAKSNDEAPPAPSDQTPGSQPHTLDFLAYDAAQGGWIAWFTGQAGEVHRLTFSTLAPLSQNGENASLAIGGPRAVISKASLNLPAAGQGFSIANATLLSQESKNDGTSLKLAGLTGPATVAWKRTHSATPEREVILAATGAVDLSINGRTLRGETRLTVQSYGGPFDQFRVRLPPGASLIRDTRPDSPTDRNPRITLEEDRSLAGGNDRQVVRIQFPEKQSGPVVVDLSTEQSLENLTSDTRLSLSGVELLGDARQSGDVALRITGDSQPRWDIGRDVRQVDPGDLAPELRQSGLVAAFHYDRQPWMLGIRLAERSQRVSVTPKYELECLLDEMRLRVRLDYQGLGPAAREFRVDLKGWELSADPVESAGVIDREQIVVENDTLILPLVQASVRRAEIAFTLRKVDGREKSQLRLPLPVPLAESIATGEFLIRAAPGIELTPSASQSTGLTPAAISNVVAAGAAIGGTEYHYHCTAPDALFVGDFVRRPRDVSAASMANIHLTATDVQIEQRIDFNVRFAAIDELSFELPASLPYELRAADIVLMPQGLSAAGAQEAPLRLADGIVDSGMASGERRNQIVRVHLPQPRLGRFSIRVRVAWQRAGSPSRGSLPVPLFAPLDGVCSTNRVTLTSGHELTAALDATAATSWQPLPGIAANARSSDYKASRFESIAPLVLTPVDLNTPSSTIIERVWLQTWIAGSGRQDRGVFRFRSLASLVTVELPLHIEPTEVEVLLDGRPTSASSRHAGRLIVALPDFSKAVEEKKVESPLNHALHTPRATVDVPTHTLELRYRQPVGERLVTRRRLTPPQLIAAANMSEVYWQIILTGDRHIVRGPELVPCNRWQWLGSFFGQRAAKSQAELEQWVGATSGLAPSGIQSEYLYSGLSAPASIEVVTAPRWLVVLAGSGIALFAALTWIYAPVRGRSWFLAALAVALAALAVAFPTPAILLAQASLVGILLGGVGMLFARLTSHLPRPAPLTLTVSTGRTTVPRPDPLSTNISPAVTPVASSASIIRVGESNR